MFEPSSWAWRHNIPHVPGGSRPEPDSSRSGTAAELGGSEPAVALMPTPPFIEQENPKRWNYYDFANERDENGGSAPAYLSTSPSQRIGDHPASRQPNDKYALTSYYGAGTELPCQLSTPRVLMQY